MRKYNKNAPSPKDSRRGCLCPDGTYSRKCCDGSFYAQGIGSITRGTFFLYTEEGEKFIQENGNKLFK
jgi:hypothetical protein